MQNVVDVLSKDLEQILFPPERKLISNLDEVYELELALFENHLLTDEELLGNGAYFARVGRDYTRHFLMCTGESLKLPQHSSSRLKSFFGKNLFRTGYATHGLFPYRGKFHPEMIKGLLNVMGLKHGETVLDPMMGSGTVLVEACLMGINSIGIDFSPFCRFMTQVKIDALSMSLSRAQKAINNYEEVFTYFQKKVGKSYQGRKICKYKASTDIMSVMESGVEYNTKAEKGKLGSEERETADTYNFLLLAYLDSVGYSERSSRKAPVDQFKAIFKRYLFSAEKIQKVLSGMKSELSHAEALEGDARSLPIDDASIDGIIFSPPYSFAIDYLDNDSFHLNFLGADLNNLRENMIGLRGVKLSEKFELYRHDMDKVLLECARVLRRNRFCTIIVGTNNNQLGRALGVSPEKVPGLHEILIEMGSSYGLKLVKKMSRPISGIYNTMRREYILIFQNK